ncbi:PKD domain-containing protein [Halovibrio salipaludis]|nr:PKD domain-containing protein [Halovibrio salipaludis]
MALVVGMMLPQMALATIQPWGDAGISISSTIDGEEANQEPGAIAINGDTLSRTLSVQNTGEIVLFGVAVSDGTEGNEEIVCGYKVLLPGQTRNCSLERTATEGPHALTSRVRGQGLFWWKRASDTDVSHYYGIPGYPSLEVTPLLNGEVADTEPGPELVIGKEYERRYRVENTGPLDLSNVTVEVISGDGNVHTACVIEEIGSEQQAECSETVTPEEEGDFSPGIRAAGDAVAELSAEDESRLFYTVKDPLRASPVAVPESGDAPLTVTFKPEATTNTAIERYEWDFDGDGSFDRSETVGRDQEYTYQEPGEYEVTLRVTDSRDETAEGTVKVNVANPPPTITHAGASPSNGEAPLAVSFNVSAEDEDGIEQVEFDFDGDGSYDLTRETSGTSVALTADHVYDNEGSFQPVIRVTDALGKSATADFPTLEIQALPEGAPTINATASPTEGKAPLSVTLDASVVDQEDQEIVSWEWDLDGDGQYDRQLTDSASVEHTYNRPGTYYPRVRATTGDDQTAEDVVRVEVDADFDLSVSQDTIDTAKGETVDIKTTLGGEVPASVVIETPEGRTVKTLAPWGDRSAGEYTDTWNGTNDEGVEVPQGEYRAVLLYEIDGEVKRLDLGPTTGGEQFNPSRSTLPSSFRPLAGEPLTIDFTLSEASEVTAFMGLFNLNTRLVTFMQRKVLGKGTHQITWNGEDDSGALMELPDGESYLFGIWGWTLPDNAIFVRSGAHITSMEITPRILVPSSRAGDSIGEETTIDFGLEGSADIEVSVDNTETGTEVFKESYSGFSEGDNSVVWNGANNEGELVAPGTYRIGITAVGPQGFRSMTVYKLQQVYY